MDGDRVPERRRGRQVEDLSGQQAVAADSEGTATAICHQGEELLSGGYSTSPKTDYDGGTLTALAYCKA